MKRDEIRALGAITDLETAAGIFGVTRSHAYELARHRPSELPFRVLRVGHRYRVPTDSILEALGPEAIDEVDWRAKYQEVLAISRRWEARARKNRRMLRNLLGSDDDDAADDAA